MVRAIAWSTIAAVGLGCGAQPASETARPDPAGPVDGGAEADDEIPENLVQLYLLAGASAVAPGQELTVAARLDIEPSWHIYWKNPGEAGLPTEVTLTAPEGFEVGAIRYPGPTRFDGGGGVVSYGYADLVLLSAPVTAPEDLDPGAEIELAAAATWLACREMCIEGSARATVDLPVATAEQPSAPAHREMLARHTAALPLPLETLEDATIALGSSHPSMTVTIPGAESAEYFPGPDEQLAFAGQAAVPRSGALELVVSYRPGVKTPERAAGVLAVTRGAERRYYQIDQRLEE